MKQPEKRKKELQLKNPIISWDVIYPKIHKNLENVLPKYTAWKKKWTWKKDSNQSKNNSIERKMKRKEGDDLYTYQSATVSLYQSISLYLTHKHLVVGDLMLNKNSWNWNDILQGV